jgi:hypothetical protein
MSYYAINGATPIAQPAAGATTQSAAPLPIWSAGGVDGSAAPVSAGTYTIYHVDPNGGTIAANALFPVNRSQNVDRWFAVTASVKTAVDVNALPNQRNF